MKFASYTAVIAVLVCSCSDRGDQSSHQQSSGTSETAASPAAASEEEWVKLSEILPIKVMVEPMGKGNYGDVLQISAERIELQRFKDGGLVTVASFSSRLPELEAAIQGVRKDSFRGSVSYLNPSFCDGAMVRMITPLGDISEYGVFGRGSEEKWPRAILALKPLFDLSGRWMNELRMFEVPPGQAGQ